MKTVVGSCLFALMLLYVYQGGPTPVIEPLKIDPLDTQPKLTVLNPTEVLVVNMIPRDLSEEQGQDSEPFLAVNNKTANKDEATTDQNLMIGAAFRGKYESDSGAAPLILSSTDGGMTWKLRSILLSQQIGAQTYCFSGRGNNFYGSVLTMNGSEQAVSVFHTDDPATDQPLENISTLSSGPRQFGDAPFIQAYASGPVPESASETDQRVDRVFVGQNYFGFPEPQKTRTASIRVSLNAAEKKFRLLGLEARPTGNAYQDGPAVRPAIANDGTVYVAFLHWYSKNQNQVSGDVVVTRDDNATVGANPFRDLVDQTDRLPGQIVTKDCLFSSEKLGKQRIISPLSLALDPAQNAIVYIAWGDYDAATKTHVLHVKRSNDKGQNWSEDLRTVASATNPALAVSDQGVVGLLYQQLVTAKPPEEERWETHFLSSQDSGGKWTDVALTKFPTKTEPALESDPYLGYRSHLLAINGNFYGIFSAPNTPNPSYFPQGVSFQRNNYNGRLFSNEGKEIRASIDPYFFRIALRTETSFLINSRYKGTRSDRPEPWLSGMVLRVGLPIVVGIVALLAGFAAFESRIRKLNRSNDEKFLGPALTNYKGFLTARFTDLAGKPIVETDSGSPCKLLVEFTQEQPNEDWFEEINLTGGLSANEVVFRIAIDSIDFEVPLDHKTVTVPSKGSFIVYFDVTPTPGGEGYSLFIQVFQKTQLVQVVAPKLLVNN